MSTIEEIYGFTKEEAEKIEKQDEQITPTLDITQLQVGEVITFTPTNEPETVTKKDGEPALIVKVNYKDMEHTLWLTSISIKQSMYKIQKKHKKITGLKLALKVESYIHPTRKQETRAYRIQEAV